MKLLTLTATLLLTLTSGSAMAFNCRRNPPTYDSRCESYCWGYCWGYFYNGQIPELNYFNPLCADVCCTERVWH